jgi:hypothetical protein
MVQLIACASRACCSTCTSYSSINMSPERPHLLVLLRSAEDFHWQLPSYKFCESNTKREFKVCGREPSALWFGKHSCTVRQARACLPGESAKMAPHSELPILMKMSHRPCNHTAAAIQTTRTTHTGQTTPRTCWGGQLSIQDNASKTTMHGFCQPTGRGAQ